MVDKVGKSAERQDETPMQKLARLDAERQELLDSLKAAALEKINVGIDELSALGYNFMLTEADRKAISHAPSDKSCSVCGFKTNPPHNARSHKGKEKTPFTAEEVAAKGWQIVQ